MTYVMLHVDYASACTTVAHYLLYSAVVFSKSQSWMEDIFFRFLLRSSESSLSCLDMLTLHS